LESPASENGRLQQFDVSAHSTSEKCQAFAIKTAFDFDFAHVDSDFDSFSSGTSIVEE